MAGADEGCDNADAVRGSPALPSAREVYAVPVLGKLRNLFVLVAVASAVAFAARKLGIIGADHGEPIEYAPGPSSPSGDDGEDESADE